jgi:ribosomal protein S21
MMSLLKSIEETSNVGKKWTTEEDEKLVQEIKDKKSYEEIALEHKRTITGIKSRVISNIIYPLYKDVDEEQQEINIQEISTEYKIDDEWLVYKIFKQMKTKPERKIKEVKQKTNDNDNDNNKQLFEYLQLLERKMDDINIKLDKLLSKI